MMPTRRLPAGSRRAVSTAPSALRVLLALAVMLLAVMPHATLAASMNHAATIPLTLPAQHHDRAPHASGASPCHESGEPAPAASHTMPPCCTLGCGMLAGAPQPQVAQTPARWRMVPPEAGLARPGATVEPAERPPRAPAARYHDVFA